MTANLPLWEAWYQPGNVSDYFIGYLNDEQPAKAAAEAWMRSQKLDEPGELRWDEFQIHNPTRYGCDVEYTLSELYDGTWCDTGILVQRRVPAAAEQGGQVFNR